MTGHWTDLGVRRTPPISARTAVVDRHPFLGPLLDERSAHLTEPLRGITTDGTLRPGLFDPGPTGVSTRPVVEAAAAFLEALSPTERRGAVFPMEAEEWRTWINIHPNFSRHGVMLEDLSASKRRRALDLMRSTLSAHGYGQARDIMRLNELLATVSGSPDEFGEWPYFVSVFGSPDETEPWGWQIDGHHLNINCVVIGDQLVLTPTFMGSEPCQVLDGPLAGTTVFETEERAGLDLIRSLNDTQRAAAITLPSIHPDDLPPALQHPFDGRMVGGAYHDNAIVAYEGVAGADLSDAQRRLLTTLVGTYIGWTRDGHAEVKMDEVVKHLDETWFSWMGSTSDDGPFYYRVHSPVVLVEFDHHPGVVFDNLAPSRNHVHTIVRTPNGGDYGVDLLRMHHERFDHSHGDHVDRA